jgi:predicted ribosome quality control (RQC) complex YloA/Tae2 family protein
LEEQEAAAENQAHRLSGVDSEIRRYEKKLNQLATGLAEAEKSALYRWQGELLKSHLHEISPGMKEFRLIDPTQTEKSEVVLTLDPALSPSQNLERLFKRYKKAQSAQSVLQVQIEKIRKERDRLEKDRQTLLAGGSLEVMKRSPSLPQKEKSGKTKAPAYLSTDGLILLVGRSDRENDEITFRVARGNDLWFHARGIPGSHVVVRMERRQEIPYQTLLDAATLALHFSNGRKTGKGDVLYTFRKYVQKPKGEKPGRVLCSQDKNIYIELEPARLQRLLENKIQPGLN